MGILRDLTQDEISFLERNLCRADDWQKIKVKKDFSPTSLYNVHFSGTVTLGIYKSKRDTGHGIVKPSGIYHAFVRDCRIGDNVYISGVKNLIGYEIEAQVVLENIDRLQIDGESTFGNGVEIEVLNANGNRKFPMFDLLSAQLAYLMTTYRQDLRFNAKLAEMIRHYVDTKKSVPALIGAGSVIRDCGIIRNVVIGPSAQISGVTNLTEGSILSNASAPVCIGDGVIARKFIIQSGSTVDNHAVLDKSFIGQGVKIGKQFSAENSLIFSNSECYHGEACNIFAGPFTVTHHKSTLLIAAMFSFFNAGSGSNQSNHMYKLGPIHQGIIERGGKTGSLSYLLWPSRIGAFSVVIGKHLNNFDSAEFPFSYILEDKGQTTILPALNFFTVGTKRDSAKWQSRDRRKDPDRVDLINFQLLSPFIIGKVIKAIEILEKLESDLDPEANFAYYQGMQIERTRLKKSITDYQQILHIYFGQMLISRLEQEGGQTDPALLKELFHPDRSYASIHWIDAAGMIVPIAEIKKIFATLGGPDISSISELQSRFKEIDARYEQTAWKWFVAVLSDYMTKEGKNPDQPLLLSVVENWQESMQKALRRILKDAAKEFSQKSRIGYGINGDQAMQDIEFETIVGSFDKNQHVINLKAELYALPKKAEKCRALINRVYS